MTNSLPTEILEERAAEQRRRLHSTVARMRVSVRDKMNIRRNTEDYSRHHFSQAAATVSTVGLALGWALGGIFDRS
jgi:ElaB/YqjD/DUF883 family membrane-anchored ribosome-binding protein